MAIIKNEDTESFLDESSLKARTPGRHVITASKGV